MSKTIIETQVRIWDAEYVIDDQGEKIIVTIPCTKEDGFGVISLSSYKYIVKDPFEMAMLRRFAELGVSLLWTKNNASFATLEDVAIGLYRNKGWKIEDFE